MSKFKKATIEQAKLKIGFYGGPGSGKTWTALLVATNLGRTAVIDTEHGSDFYAKQYAFDVLHTKSLQEAKEAVAEIGTAKDYDCLIIDSITHLWEAAQNAFVEKLARAGKTRDLQFQDWRFIKKPYKELVNDLLNLNKHVFILGRMGSEYSLDGGQLVKVGDKMKAEGETPYEPHILVKMEVVKKGTDEHAVGTHLAYFEKDRSGLLAGTTVVNPTFETFKPVLAILSGSAQPTTAAETAVAEKDMEIFDVEESKRRDFAINSQQIKEQFMRVLLGCTTMKALNEVGKDIEGSKKHFTEEDLTTLRAEWKHKKEALTA